MAKNTTHHASSAKCVDNSGGLQEGTTAPGIPCFTIRENTEHPITIQAGTNTLVVTGKDNILTAFQAFKTNGAKQGRIPELWDGKTAERIVSILREQLHTSRQAQNV